MPLSRRQFLQASSALVAAGAASPLFAAGSTAPDNATTGMQLGLVTYNWGQAWDLPTVIAQCAATGFRGVELRTTHKHGVEIALSPAERAEVKRRFADSPVELVGLGTACEYHSSDPAVVRKNIDETREFIKLCHDCGGSGIKVRPNGLPADVPIEKTLEQIGRALNEVALYGADFGVEIRLEVHGRGTQELPNIKAIMDVADRPNVGVCWNCNPVDLQGDGLEHNFKLVQDRLGATVHIHDLRKTNYPWPELFALLKGVSYAGWTLVEEGSTPSDVIGAMHEVRRRWEQLVA